ncbi:MAG TPA: cupredoxin family protein [Thermodesulfobacteriota bacterium]
MDRLVARVLLVLVLAVAGSAGLPSLARSAGNGHGHGGAAGEHPHGAQPTAAGRPGRAADVTRTVRIEARDIAFDVRRLEVRAGETVRFVVTNVGRLPHEFAIGTREELAAHRRAMVGMPNMVHDEPNVLGLRPGETKALIWRFAGRGDIEFACNIPGHTEAGMRGDVEVVGTSVEAAGAATTDPGRRRASERGLVRRGAW